MPPVRASQGQEWGECLLPLRWGAAASLLKSVPCRDGVWWTGDVWLARRPSKGEVMTGSSHTAPRIWGNHPHKQELIPSPCPIFFIQPLRPDGGKRPLNIPMMCDLWYSSGLSSEDMNLGSGECITNASHYQPSTPACQTSLTFLKATITFSGDAKDNMNVSACIEVIKSFS